MDLLCFALSTYRCFRSMNRPVGYLNRSFTLRMRFDTQNRENDTPFDTYLVFDNLDHNIVLRNPTNHLDGLAYPWMKESYLQPCVLIARNFAISSAIWVVP